MIRPRPVERAAAIIAAAGAMQSCTILLRSVHPWGPARPSKRPSQLVTWLLCANAAGRCHERLGGTSGNPWATATTIAVPCIARRYMYSEPSFTTLRTSIVTGCSRYPGGGGDAYAYYGRCSRYSGSKLAARRHPTRSIALGWARPNPNPSPNPNPNHKPNPKPNPNPSPSPNPHQVGTSGLLLCAKTTLARRALSMALQVSSM